MSASISDQDTRVARKHFHIHIHKIYLNAESAQKVWHYFDLKIKIFTAFIQLNNSTQGVLGTVFMGVGAKCKMGVGVQGAKPPEAIAMLSSVTLWNLLL